MRDDVVDVAVAQLMAFLAHAPVGRHLLIPGFGGFAIEPIGGRLQIAWRPDVELNAMARGDRRVAFPGDDQAEAILAEWRAAGIEVELAPAISPLPAFGRLLFEALRAGGCVEIDDLGRFAVVASGAGGNVVRFSAGEALVAIVERRAAENVTLTGLAAVS